mmetsp:Transcript_68841/g.206483  ORF Transcript_68841/g.206483 Transcript_68841/m.206483 type:complete len:91 (+) Transcript_68841:629-901(+)
MSHDVVSPEMRCDVSDGGIATAHGACKAPEAPNAGDAAGEEAGGEAGGEVGGEAGGEAGAAVGSAGDAEVGTAGVLSVEAAAPAAAVASR